MAPTLFFVSADLHYSMMTPQVLLIFFLHYYFFSLY